MGSLAGKEGLPNLAAYSAASAGVIAFTKALSREVNDSDIRVNCIAPGPIDTRMIRDLGNEVVDAMISASPLKRLGDPKEVAALVVWLCSDASAFNRAGAKPAAADAGSTNALSCAGDISVMLLARSTTVAFWPVTMRRYACRFSLGSFSMMTIESKNEICAIQRPNS